MIRFVVALPAEARPLIERFKLVRAPRADAFKVFRREDVALVVSGPGKAAAAAATAYLHLATGGERDAAWLNVGIAGHGSRAVGEALVAHKVRDRAGGRAWYPPQLAALPCASDEVVTVDRPETAFAEPGAHDMEAAGFYPIACRFATAEVVQCLKIVSDGPADAPPTLSASAVAELIGRHLETAEALAEACCGLSRAARVAAADPPDLACCLERWHFTVSERRQLRRLLRRRRTLAAEIPLPLDDLPVEARGGEVNRHLRRWLDALPVRL